MSVSRMNRRRFLKVTAAGAAMLRRWARATQASPTARGANERLVVGFIGMGGRGESLLKQALALDAVSVAAFCDVDQKHLDKALSALEGKAAGCRDYRKMLDRKDIDAVVIATPDHWHALQTIDACRAGKDVYCEKPLSHNVVEGRAMVRAARRHGRVVQTGTQHRTEADIRRACELIRSGRIGKVDRVEMWIWSNPYEPITPGSDPPPHLDWNLWLGPAPKVPYHPKRCHINFRWFRDYAAGYMTDWGVHMYNVVSWAMDADLAAPVAVEGRETLFENNLYQCPRTQDVRWVFRDPDFTMTWTEPAPARESEKYGIRFHGSQGVLEVLFGKHRLLRDGKEVPGEPEPGARSGDVTLPRTPDNMTNWIEAVRTRSKPLNDLAIGHANATVCNIGDIASRLGRALKWDGKNERFDGDREANDLLSYPYRPPWRLG